MWMFAFPFLRIVLRLVTAFASPSFSAIRPSNILYARAPISSRLWNILTASSLGRKFFRCLSTHQAPNLSRRCPSTRDSSRNPPLDTTSR
ncbi:hypothetical protein B0H16DRAFT_1519540 [Mycena metata]|uniref:Secreted protein n=1 Tax=Mycena metata TaxID=1033252 RepID=A0AAD7NNM7_9AGAR|nr:hypothetical protein B0H16DRAFT_1519540 [Mycena metata]